jgi:hypothetical protein
MSGCAGRTAAGKTELESRIRKGPMDNAYISFEVFVVFVSKNKESTFQPKTSAPVPNRNANAKDDRIRLGMSDGRVTVNGLGSGI